MQTYLETHPWITFSLNLKEAPFKLWLLLGEAQSKAEHIAGVPLLPDVARELHQIFLAKGALATTAIEGNTLTEVQVRQRLEGKLDLPPSKEYLGQEIDNVVEACNEIANMVFADRIKQLSVDDIKDYNRLVLKNLPLNENVIPGEIRTHSVTVGNYLGAPPEDCDYLLQKLCQWLNDDFQVPEGYKVAFGIIKAIMAHVYIAWIHPFGDGNGRTARLIEFQILLSTGVPSTAAQLLSNHYNLTRTEYYRHLDRLSREGDDIVLFISYALQGFVDGLHEQIETIKLQQLHVHWINYIHELFKDRDGITDTRRRRLVLDLSKQKSPVPISKIRHISPRIAEAYASKTDKTVHRDLNELTKIGLIQKKPGGYYANISQVLAFLPNRKEPVGTNG